jgi:hypothetical protein
LIVYSVLDVDAAQIDVNYNANEFPLARWVLEGIDHSVRSISQTFRTNLAMQGPLILNTV